MSNSAIYLTYYLLTLTYGHTGADSLEYLSVDGLIKAVQRNIDGKREIGHCTACLTGDYPGGIPEELDW